MKLSEDIQTVSEFKQNASKIVKRIQKTKQPVVLTVNGRAAVVIQDAAEFQATASRREYELTIAAIDEALADFDNRYNWRTHDDVFDDLFKRNGIQS